MIKKGGETLPDLETWVRLAGPKSGIHWQDGRSAKECARAWLGSGPSKLPDEIQKALTSHPDFSTIEEWTAEPEARVSFDSFRGEPSNVDMLLVARDTGGPFVVAVEVKADETFGATVAGTARAASQRLETNPRSKGMARLEQLVQAILGHGLGLDQVGEYRYQLLTVTAAALAEAERRSADRAVVLIHEFITSRTADDRHRQNAEDLNGFVSELSDGTIDSLHGGQLEGPIDVAGTPLISQPASLYFGKSVRDLRG